MFEPNISQKESSFKMKYLDETTINRAEYTNFATLYP